jgi:hypothetical protein
MRERHLVMQAPDHTLDASFVDAVHPLGAKKKPPSSSEGGAVLSVVTQP